MSKKVIFLEEDSDDWTLVEDSLQELGIEASINFVPDSTALFAALEKGALPALILVDFNAVPENGLEVLQRIKRTESWQAIPVVILSESNDEKYRAACYRSGASAFIKKPDTHEESLRKIGTFFRYWFEVVEA